MKSFRRSFPSPVSPSRLWISAAAVAVALASIPVGAQSLDLEQGIRLFQQFQEFQDSGNRKKNDERERGREGRDRKAGRESDRSSASAPSRDSGAEGLRRRVTGTWEQRSRVGRDILTREFRGDGRYILRENGEETERGRWSAADGETLVLRPDGGRSPSRLVIARIDRSSMDAQYEVDADNDAQPLRWTRISSSGSDADSRPGVGTGNRFPTGPISEFRPGGGRPGSSATERDPRERKFSDGFYRVPGGATLEIRGEDARISDRRGVGPWISVDDFMVRSEGGNRIRFVHRGQEQIAIRSSSQP
jgi:hypothetical protein